MLGVHLSGRLASIFTGLKLIALGGIILVGLIFGSQEHFAGSVESIVSEANEMPLIKAILLALVGVFWSFGGWHHATYLSGEAKDPDRTVPKAMIYGVLTVTVVYILANIAFMRLVPEIIMGSSTRIAGDALSEVFSAGGKMVAVAIIVSILGTISIYSMTAPRIYYSMAKDGIFFKTLAKVHPKWQTPYVAMAFQAIWAAILILVWHSFTRLITFVTFMDIVFMMLASITIFIFRKQDQSSVYKVPGYPWVPLIYILVTFAFVIHTLISLSWESWVGMVILLAGIPVFYLVRK